MKWFEGLPAGIRAAAKEEPFDSNAGFILAEHGPLLVDSFATPSAGKALYDAAVTAVAAAGSGGPANVALVYTHEHGDHTFGTTGLDPLVLASRQTADGMRDEYARNAKVLADNGLAPKPPSAEFEGRLTLAWEPDIVVVELGGHSRGSTVVWIPAARTLFTGDLVFSDAAAWVGDGDLPLWVASLREMESWGAARVIPGHGPVGGSELLTAQRLWLERFDRRLGELREEGNSAREAISQLSSEFFLDAANGYDERLLDFMSTALRDRWGFPG